MSHSPDATNGEELDPRVKAFIDGYKAADSKFDPLDAYEKAIAYRDSFKNPMAAPSVVPSETATIGEVVGHKEFGLALVQWSDNGMRPIGMKVYASPPSAIATTNAAPQEKVKAAQSSSPGVVPVGAAPVKVWAVLKHYRYEGDDLVAILGSKKEAEKVAARIQADEDFAPDSMKVQEWAIGEVNE